MIAKNLIHNSIPSLPSSANANEVLAMMEEHKIRHFSIVDGNRFVGLVSEEDVFSVENPEAPIGKKNKILKKFYVKSTQHLYDVMKIISDEKLTIIPVLDGANKFLGIITPQDIVEKFANYATINQPGGIIVLSVSSRDYLASQIVQIVESNDAKLLSLFVSSNPDSAMLEVTLKINRQDINGILQTFHRYEYEVVGSWFDDDLDYLQDRFDSLMNFLSI